MRIAVLALQGAFLEHEMLLNKLGVDCFEVRQLKDWQQEKDGLISLVVKVRLRESSSENLVCWTLFVKLLKVDYLSLVLVQG